MPSTGAAPAPERPLPAPRFSVLITTRDPARRPFLDQAVRSCHEQRPTPSDLEVVIASAYALDPASLPAGPLPLRVVASGGGTQGGRIVDAAGAARGEYYLLMDDDDVFERGKLARLREVLQREPHLSYYHHECLLTDAEGREVRATTFHRNTSRFKGAGYYGAHDDAAKRQEAGRWVRAFAFFNPSSIVVSRELAEAAAPLLPALPTAPDLGIFFRALASPGRIYFDEERLTRYRVHPGNESMLRWPDLSLEFRVNAVRTLEILRERYGPELPPRARSVLDSMALSGAFGVAVLSGRHNQGEVGRAMWRLFRASNPTDRLTRFSSVLVALAYLWNPPAAQWWLRRVRVRDELAR